MSDEQDDEMTPELAAALRGLRRELAPSDLLEERVVRTLKVRNLLRPQRSWGRSLRWAAAVAAALLLFFSGMTLGRKTAATRYATNRPPTTVGGQAPVVEQVRQTGAAYADEKKPQPSSTSRQVFWF